MKDNTMANTWMITGANSGFGKLLVERLLRRGDRVAGSARRLETLDGLDAGEGEFVPIQLDLTDEATIDSGVARAVESLGRIDVVVSNAGYGTFGAIEELSPQQIRRQIETNLVGTILFLRAVLPHLRRQGGGRILQVSSEGGRIAYPGFSTYHASKWGQEGFVEAVAQEVAPFGIEMCLIEPGPTGTNFLAGIDMGEPLEAYDGTPTAGLREAMQAGDFNARMGDPAKMADIMIELALANDLPLRMPLGSVAWDHIDEQLDARRNLHSQQKQRAYGCDVDA